MIGLLAQYTPLISHPTPSPAPVDNGSWWVKMSSGIAEKVAAASIEASARVMENMGLDFKGKNPLDIVSDGLTGIVAGHLETILKSLHSMVFSAHGNVYAEFGFPLFSSFFVLNVAYILIVHWLSDADLPSLNASLFKFGFTGLVVGALMVNWPSIAEQFSSMIMRAADTMVLNGGGAYGTDVGLSPLAIVRKGSEVMQGMFLRANQGPPMFASDLVSFFVMLLLGFMMMAMFYMLAIIVFIASAEFLFLLALGALFLPFTLVKPMAFLGERYIGSVASSAIKLGVLKMTVGVSITLIGQFTFDKTTTFAAMFSYICGMAAINFLSIKAPALAQSIASGSASVSASGFSNPATSWAKQGGGLAARGVKGSLSKLGSGGGVGSMASSLLGRLLPGGGQGKGNPTDEALEAATGGLGSHIGGGAGNAFGSLGSNQSGSKGLDAATGLSGSSGVAGLGSDAMLGGKGKGNKNSDSKNGSQKPTLEGLMDAAGSVAQTAGKAMNPNPESLNQA